MALWRLLRSSENPNSPGAVMYTPVPMDLFDDGRSELPGEAGFTREDIDAFLETDGGIPRAVADYAGRTPGTLGYHERRAAAEAKQIAETEAKSRILVITDPEGYALVEKKSAAREQYDALSPYASSDELTKLSGALGVIVEPDPKTTILSRIAAIFQ